MMRKAKFLKNTGSPTEIMELVPKKKEKIGKERKAKKIPTKIRKMMVNTGMPKSVIKRLLISTSYSPKSGPTKS